MSEGRTCPTSIESGLHANKINVDTQPGLTRSTRRSVLNEPTDENRNPFVDSDGVENDEEIVNASIEPAKKKACREKRSVPSKHGAPEQRVTISPSKINSHFKVGKSVIPVFEDSKHEPQATPSTPRHRDAASKKVPITPRHRVLLAGGQLTPRTPKTPITLADSRTPIYRQARQLFSRCSNPGRLVGRDEEREQLSTFITTCLEGTSAGCLYISGPPGTGKSALVTEVLEQFTSGTVSSSVINCMSVRNAKDLSRKLSDDFGLEENAGIENLRAHFVHRKAKDTRKYLVILDEVDRLVDLNLDLLYNLFEWSMQPSSRLVLLGIANALDLTDRFLPRLKARSLKPALLPFMPYTATQIAGVLTAKLKSLSPSDETTVPFLHPAAIQFCAKKVAAQTGDLRKAFDISRRAIDLVEQETRDQDAKADLQDSPIKMPLMENINLSSPPTSRSPQKKSTPAYTLETAPKATIAHMAKVTAQAFSNGTTQRLGSLHLQQKAVLCALSTLEKQKRDGQVNRTMFATPSKKNYTAPSVKQLFEAYTTLCNREKLLHPLSSVEFRDVISGLETLSLVCGADGRSGSFVMPMTPSKTPSRKGKTGFAGAAVGDDRRLASVVGQKELCGTLEGAGADLLREILEGDVLL